MFKESLNNATLKMGGRLLALCCLLGIISLFWVAPVQAQAPEPTNVEPCESCHSPEAEAWMVSPHANVPEGSEVPGATCEDCHGAYVKGHPDSDVMELRVDSSMCQDCHASTFDQWQGTVHADANVQCISCHVSHSQNLRLTDERLCRSCHQDSLSDPFHSAHWYVEASCVDCHMAGEAMTGKLVMVDSDGLIAGGGHDFTTVSSEKCLDCHRSDVVNADNPSTTQQVALAELRTQTLRVAELDAELEQAKQTTYTLQVMTPMTLGFGIGIGGMLGIIFMLAMSRFNRKDRQS